MNIDYTPGPWLPTAHLDVVSEDGRPIARLASTRGKYEYEEANARLIAAAPDLLAVLVEIVASDAEAIEEANAAGIPFPPAMLATYNKARAAIAKATGETP